MLYSIKTVSKMFEKNLKFAYRIDIYGSLLDKTTAAVMTAYYEDDLSLSEIALDVGISRQGVWQMIQKGKKELTFYEERLALYERENKIDEAVSLLQDALKREDGGGDIRDELSTAIALLKGEES